VAEEMEHSRERTARASAEEAAPVPEQPRDMVKPLAIHPAFLPDCR
jgi:hypothetical protein